MTAAPRPRWLRRAPSRRGPQITLAAERERGSIAVKATARVPSPADRKGAVLYVALADDGLSSDVKAGENAGARLVHDNVVRLFRAGPSPDANGEMRWDLTLPVPAEAGSASTVVAFVQNAAAGDVLQALALPLTRRARRCASAARALVIDDRAIAGC